ncbi:unnamed protein product [Phyllotreta striolata]|uniref:Uncharacterized protein n=1 Tax=Phyllotreta striolata TaxID=444603 RepID=A0A9N9TH09_PHYSR|nr:unnamed protein product [Phyllotreta striolata]
MKLHVSEFFATLLVLHATRPCSSHTRDAPGKSRGKRYVAFPEGTTFIANLCDTLATTTGFNMYFQGINWGTGWVLPNRTSVLNMLVELNEHKRKRIQRRAIYSKVETMLEAVGYEGASCVYRALCEAPRKFRGKSTKLSEELLRIFFKYPLQGLLDDEPPDHHHYHKAHRIGKFMEHLDCSEIYPDCPVSLIDLALGYYHS